MNKSSNVLLGFAETDITPESPSLCELVGFNRPDNRARGILHELKSQVLIFKRETQYCCLITVDSIGFTTELTNRLRDSVAARITAKQENIMVCFSHTHSAPDAATGNNAYFQFAYGKILRAVDSACNDLSPVKAAWGIAENNIGVNRRQRTDAMDDRIGVLKITDATSDETKLLLLRVTAHANILTGDNFLISSDYFGATRELLEKKHGCKVMLTQGAAGNIKPKYRQKNADFLDANAWEAALATTSKVAVKKNFAESMVSLNKTAIEIYKSVDRVLGRLAPSPIYRLETFSDTLTFHADTPTIERARAIAKEAAREAGIDGTQWIKEVNRLIRDNIQYQETTTEIQYFVVGDGCLCGVAYEPMCEIAMSIRHEAADDFIFFGGYTNGCLGYLPNAEEYDKGGYEVLWSNLIYFHSFGRVMPLNRDTATKLVNSVCQRWKSVLHTS